MNNKLLLFLPIVLFTINTYAAQTAAERVNAFLDMESGHKSDWFNYMKNVHDSKYELLNTQHKDWITYKKQNINNLEKSTLCSDTDKETYFNDALNKAITLHKKHIEQFKNLCNENHQKGVEIEIRHEKELDKFIGKSTAKKGMFDRFINKSR